MSASCLLQDVKGENKNLKKQSIAELAPFLINYLREKTSHHLTPRQNATSTPKKTPILQSKGVKSTNDQSRINKNSSKGTLFLSQKTPSPSPVTPLSQSRREKLQERHASPCSSPRLRKKSPKVQGNDRYQQKLNIDDPDDFPPMGTSRWSNYLLFFISGVHLYNNTVTTYLWQFSKIIEQFKGNRVEVACELQTYFGLLLLSLRKTLLFFGGREVTTGNMSAVHRLELRRLRETLGLG